MAEIPPGDRVQADHDAFFRDTDDSNKSYRRVRDPKAILILQAIADAIGAPGTSNTIPTIANVDCALAGTEYSYALPANSRGFTIKARGNSKIEFTYATGASDVWTIWPGAAFTDQNFYTSQTIYFKCSKADETVEIVSYVS